MSTAQVEVLRSSAAVAVVVLAVLLRGDLLVLAALLVVTSWRPWALAVVPALVAAAWRWGSSSLDALAGAQAVLGPAGFVGPTAAAASSWLAALAVLLVTTAHVGGMGVPNRAAGAPNLMFSALAAGAVAAAVVAGPATARELWIRLVATLAATGLALAIARLRAGGRWTGRVLDVLGVGAALGAVAAVTTNAPDWSGTIDGQALRDGITIGMAIIVLVVAVATLEHAHPLRRAA